MLIGCVVLLVWLKAFSELLPLVNLVVKQEMNKTAALPNPPTPSPAQTSDGGSKATEQTNTTATPVATTTTDKLVAAVDKVEKKEIEIDSFFYIHVPKTGTSLYTVLRNRLKSCKVKDFTCFGVLGGGLWAVQSKDGKDHYPYSAKSLGIVEDGNVSLHAEASCGGTLNCPGPGFEDRFYHCSYSKKFCRNKKNKVTMFREPRKWLKSFYEWTWLNEMSTSGRHRLHNSLKSFPPPMEFTTGKKELATTASGNNTKNETAMAILLDEAFEILQREYLWWGVTDHWSATVCVFHCELGGQQRPSETANSRKAFGEKWMKNITEFELTLPKTKRRNKFITSNYTRSAEQKFPAEVAFYHKKIMPEFRRRAIVCGCDL